MSMRRSLATALLAISPVSSAWPAISNNIQVEVRPAGNNNNGGGFVAGASGTDFSQQDTAQFTFADLASANGTTTPCVVSSASHNFVASDVGNLIQITAGTNWTTGWYSINSVAANQATLDRSCGSVAALSGGTWFEGGGLATLAQAANLVNTAVDGAGGSLNGTVNVKTGTYTLTAAVAPNANYAMVWVGYQTTHGDQGTAPTVTTATNSTPLFTIAGSTHIFDNFTFTNTAITPAAGLNMSGGAPVFVEVRNSSFSGFTNAVNCSATTDGCDLIGVEIKNSTGDGFTGGGMTCVGCYIHNNTGNGITGTFPITVINSIVANNAIGILGGASPGVVRCINSDIANNSSDGIRAVSSHINALNCVLYGNGGFGVNGPGVGTSNVFPVNLGRNNGYGNNTSGPRNNYTSAPGALTGTAAALGDVALTANPFTSATNFALNNTAGGGAALNTAGWPGAFPAGLTTGTQNIGAVQSGGAAAASTGACKIR